MILGMIYTVLLSPPAWGRGLKLDKLTAHGKGKHVAPCMGRGLKLRRKSMGGSGG